MPFKFTAHCVACLCVLLTNATRADQPTGTAVQLFNGTNLSGWEYFLVDDSKQMQRGTGGLPVHQR
jgi:hypothetical protein